METIKTPAHDLRATGAFMIFAAALSMFTMAHHPSNADDAALANIVHGTMLAVTLTLLAGFARFTVWRGSARFLVIFGLVAYGAGAVGNMLAATMSGFIVPVIAGREISEGLVAFARAFNQSLAYEAVYAIGAAYAAWGVDLVSRERGIDRGLGVFAVVAGAAPAAALALGVVDMHVVGANLIYAVHALFAIATGLRLITAKGK